MSDICENMSEDFLRLSIEIKFNTIPERRDRFYLRNLYKFLYVQNLYGNASIGAIRDSLNIPEKDKELLRKHRVKDFTNIHMTLLELKWVDNIDCESEFAYISIECLNAPYISKTIYDVRVYTMLEMACDRKMYGLINLLLSHGADPKIFYGGVCPSQLLGDDDENISLRSLNLLYK